MKFRVCLYPGLKGEAETPLWMKKRIALEEIREYCRGWCCGATVYIQRVRPKKKRRGEKR
jgi:hypothetical protein